MRGGWGRVLDPAASVRAIRRKGSWESYESGWSWRAAQAGEAGYGVLPRSAVQSPISAPPVVVGEDGEGAVNVIGLIDGPGLGTGTVSTKDSFVTAQTKLTESGDSPFEDKRFDLGENVVLLTAI